MGLYDSFIYEYNGQKCELQTKAYDCLLNHWELGDVVFAHNSPYPLNQVVVNRWDDDGKFAAAIVCDGIYIEYIFGNSYEDATNKAQTILDCYINNPEKIKPTLLKLLTEQSAKLNAANDQIDFGIAKLYNIEKYLQGEDTIFVDNAWSFLNRFKDLPMELKQPDASEEDKLRYLLTALIKDIKEHIIEQRNVYIW